MDNDAKSSPIKTDIGQAIIDAVEKRPDYEMPRWLKWVYDELKKQREDERR